MSGVTSTVSDQLMRVLDAPAWLAYATVFALVFVEDALFVGFFVPGETLAILGGVAANLGHVSLAAMITVVVVAAVAGDSVGYEVGRHLGPRLLETRPLRRHRDRLTSAQGQLARRGGTAVFLARWTAFLRAVTPALAGASGLRYRTFAVWNGLGGLAWGGTCVVAGYLAGRSFGRVESWLGRGAAVVAACVALGLAGAWHLRRRRRRQEAALEPDRTGASAFHHAQAADTPFDVPLEERSGEPAALGAVPALGGVGQHPVPGEERGEQAEGLGGR